MDVGEYISKDNQQLKDKNFCKKLNEDPKRKHGNIVNNTIKNLKKTRAKKLTTRTSEHNNFIFHQNYINQTL